MKPDAIVEVSMYFFYAGDKEFAEDLDNFHWLGHAWEDASDEILVSLEEAKNFKMPDALFTKDAVAFEFNVVGELNHPGESSMVDHFVLDCGWDDTAGHLRNELVAMAKAEMKPGARFHRMLTAWEYWHDVDYSGEVDCGVELLGRVTDVVVQPPSA